MLSPETWARAIRDNGFDVNMDIDFDPVSFSGFLPCPDSNCGFEYYFEWLDQSQLEFSDGEKSVIGDRKFIVTFVCKTEVDLLAANAAAAVLTYLCDGVLLEAEANVYVQSENVIAWARGELDVSVVSQKSVSGPKPRVTIVQAVQLIFLVIAIGVLLYKTLRNLNLI